MKIQPVPQGALPVSTPEGSSASNSRKERAAKAFEGVKLAPSENNPPSEYEYKQFQAAAKPKTIKFNTKASIYKNVPDDLLLKAEAPVEGALAASDPAPEDNAQIPVSSEQASTATEDTKPLSPQFAQLAKAKRALQAKEREIAAREAALAGKSETSETGLLDRVKSDPMGVLREAGFSYADLTEAVLAEQSTNPNITRLERQVQDLKTALDNQSKSLVEKDQYNEKQVLTQMRKNTDAIVAQGDDAYELVRATNSQPLVVDLIKRTFDETGEIMDEYEALGLVEEELFQESFKLAQLKKIQSKLTPGQPQQPAPAGAAQKQIRTLTARDGTSVPLSAKERAMLAFKGQLPR